MPIVDDNLKHRLAAVLNADVVGYSRLMAEDEAISVRNLQYLQSDDSGNESAIKALCFFHSFIMIFE